MAKTWHILGKNMTKARPRHGPGIAQTYSTHGSDNRHGSTWFKHGSDIARHGLDLAPA